MFDFLRKPAVRDRIGSISLVVLSLFIPIYAWISLVNSNSKTAQDHFNSVINYDLSQLKSRFEIYADTLYSGRALLMTDQTVTSKDWANFVKLQNINKRYPGIINISYASLSGSSNAQKAEIVYQAPANTSSQPLGYNLLSNAAQASALDSARDSGLARASLPITDATTGHSGQTLLIAIAAYKNISALDTPAERQAAVKGYVVLSLYTQQMLDSIFKDAPTQDQVSVAATADNRTVYILGANYSSKALQKTVNVDVAGQPWQLNFSAPKTFGLTKTANYAPMIVIISFVPFLITLGFGIYYALKYRNLKNRKHNH